MLAKIGNGRACNKVDLSFLNTDHLDGECEPCCEGAPVRAMRIFLKESFSLLVRASMINTSEMKIRFITY
jgi:hypothetical protein